jgi:uncharacterized membrane protein required for colicin V production|tara:strand:+ start:234 stop:500 length:267 start_codon:yes stop_codon:yes gene_type:complete
MISQIAQDIQSQSVNSMVGGFSFAAAIAWMDVVRWIIANTVKTSKNGGIYYLITALATTLLAVLVFTALNLMTKDDLKKQQAVFAVTR